MKSQQLHAVPFFFTNGKNTHLLHRYNDIFNDWREMLADADAQGVVAKSYSFLPMTSVSELNEIAKGNSFEKLVEETIITVAKEYIDSDEDPIDDPRIQALKPRWEREFEEPFEETIFSFLNEFYEAMEG